jgi:hypothetical protein
MNVRQVIATFIEGIILGLGFFYGLEILTNIYSVHYSRMYNDNIKNNAIRKGNIIVYPFKNEEKDMEPAEVKE